MGGRPVVVYTALFGGYDRLLEQPDLEGVTFVCFTDDASLRSRTWEVRRLPAAPDPRRAARAVKALPHRHLPDHEWSIWVDARLSIRSDDFPARLVDAAEPSGVALMAHRQRADVYQEAAEVYRKGFDASPALLGQVRRYRRAGLPAGSGLWSSMVVARRHRDEAVVAFGERWDEEIRTGSCRDQVALPYVVWSTGLRPGTLDLDPYRNELYVLHHHLVPRRYPARWRQALAATRFHLATRA